MEMEPDIENMTISEYLKYEAVKERRLLDDVRSRRSSTNYNKADVDSFHQNKRAENIKRMGHDIVHHSIWELDDDSEEDQEEDGDDDDTFDRFLHESELAPQTSSANCPFFPNELLLSKVPSSYSSLLTLVNLNINFSFHSNLNTNFKRAPMLLFSTILASPKALDDMEISQLASLQELNLYGTQLVAVVVIDKVPGGHFQQNPSEIHWTAVKTILKYLRNNKDMVHVYGAKSEDELKVSCYVDASFQTDKDDTKSQTVYVFILNGGAIDWKSAKQSTTAMSSTKVEYIAAAEASMEAVWMKKFIDRLGDVVPSNKRPMEMLCDNEPAIAIATDPGILSGAIHFQRKYHYIREVIQEREIVLKKVYTDDNVADLFTRIGLQNSNLQNIFI
ncbi:hypothetical protein Tco_1506918 [Tanacetum coccineum]